MLSEDNSSDIVAINSDDEDEFMINSDKPIIQLFKRLISSNNKHSTILTNAEIVVILNKEFDTQISKIPELEGDIYLTIMKKFLKDWPQWDQFDKVVNKLKRKRDYAGVNRLLESNYVNLKTYLRDMLECAQDITQKTIQKVVADGNGEKCPTDQSNRNVVLEICASRNQLNQLFYRQPQPDSNNTVFNSIYSVPTQITINMLPLEAILNWWGVNISITSEINATNKIFLYERETKHRIEHVLVNKKNRSAPCPIKAIPQDIRVKNTVLAPKIDKLHFLEFIMNVSAEFENCKEIFEFIKKDILLLPAMLHPRLSYNRYMNKYPYVRYLYKEAPFKDECKYDLQLKETVSPQYLTYVGKIQVFNKKLTVKCIACNINFFGGSLIQDLRSHFTEHHMMEPDFKCTNCGQSFSMNNLAHNWWTHRC